jgi:hypothetical protein
MRIRSRDKNSKILEPFAGEEEGFHFFTLGLAMALAMLKSPGGWCS